MTGADSSEVTLRGPDGETVEMTVGKADQVTCPECSSENVEIHSLDRVLAGECATCFHTWTIGPLTDWEVEP